MTTPADEPTYVAFFGVMGATSAMVFSGKSSKLVFLMVGLFLDAQVLSVVDYISCYYENSADHLTSKVRERGAQFLELNADTIFKKKAKAWIVPRLMLYIKSFGNKVVPYFLLL